MQKISLTFLTLLISLLSNAQLSNFNFTVSVINETCLGNGALNFNTSNVAVGSTLTYEVYLLPNTINPLLTTANNNVTGLHSGIYLVKAIQTLGAASTIEQQQVEILNTVQTLNYTLSSVNPTCNSNGQITVNVNTGNPVSYQLIAGPITTPVQSNNTFNNLPTGLYQVSVVDACGNVSNQSYLLQQVTTAVNYITIESNTILVDCSTIQILGNFNTTPNSQIAFPLTFVTTVNPPNGGTPIQIINVFNNASSFMLNVPFYNGQLYSYSIQVTDACGNISLIPNTNINKAFDLEIIEEPVDCTLKKILLNPKNGIEPYTINFLSAPVGFNPIIFNNNHPGPFTSLDEIIYGGVGNGLPIGNYSIQITDSCGNVKVKNLTINPVIISPIAYVSNNGCGTISLLLNNALLQQVFLISAPLSYPNPLPFDLSAYINTSTHIFNLSGFAVGQYLFKLIDNCGGEHTITVNVTNSSNSDFVIHQFPGCDLNYGTTRIYSSDPIVSASIINAPATFIGVLPTSMPVLSNSYIFLANLPEGIYTLKTINSCGVERINQIQIVGYHENPLQINIERNCSSFNLQFSQPSNASSIVQYWLQKYNSSTGQWIHPQTNSVYSTGVPNAGNSFLIQENNNNLNLNFTGKFRILKHFTSISSMGTISNCLRNIYDFEIYTIPQLINVTSIGCTNGNSETIVNATGVPPLLYKITTKNGQPFVVNNGSSNVFQNLDIGIYNFQLEDSCGNISNAVYEITRILPINIETSIVCDGQDGALYVPNYSFLNYEWFNYSNPSTILSTTNVLNFSPFISSVNFGTYGVRITSVNNSNSCLNSELSYMISNLVTTPNAGNDNSLSICTTGTTINLQNYLSLNANMNGSWTELSSMNASLTGSSWNINNAQDGVYQFNYHVVGLCGLYDDAIITINFKRKPIFENINSNYQVCKGDSFQINSNQNNASYTYLWNGPNGFTSVQPNLIFNDIQLEQSGIYTLEISNGNCISDSYPIVITVSDTPQFIIVESCINNVKALEVIPLHNSFNTSNVNYDWTGPNGFSSNTNPIFINNESVGIYSVNVTNNSCTLNNQRLVESLICEIPKGISPNNDGLNDFFDLSAFDVESLKIFNRYGREVFFKIEYKNEWHGQDFKGHLLPTATYYYVLYLNNGETKTGWVYLQR